MYWRLWYAYRMAPPRKSAGSTALLGSLPLLAMLSLAAVHCIPRPAAPTVSCEDDAKCEATGAGYKYCLKGTCVECFTATSCDERSVCVDGKRYKQCEKPADCAKKQVC